MHIGLWLGYQILFRHKGKTMETASLYFILSISIAARVIGISFFCHPCIRFYFKVLSHCTFRETFAIEFQNWFVHKRIDSGAVSWNMASFVDFIFLWNETCKNCWNFFPFWWHQVFSITSVRNALGSSLNVLVTFRRTIFLISIDKL